MLLKQYYLGCLAHASYLIADEETKQAVIVDPQRDIDQYLADAEEQGLRIEHVFLTHFHADFVAGHLELRDRVGARIHIGARAETEYEAVAMSDDDTLEIGQVRLVVTEERGVSGNHPSVYEHFGLDVGAARMVVVKTASNWQFYNDFMDQVIRVDTPGATTSHVEDLPWRDLPRPIYPMDAGTTFGT